MKTEWIIWAVILGTIYLGSWSFSRIRFLLASHDSLPGLRLPFDGWWYVAVGGRVFPNHHISARAQQFAYDFSIAIDDSGKTHRGDQASLNQYLCFDQPIFAAHDGTVVIAVDGVPDNPVGTLNPQMVYGNAVMIAHDTGLVSVYAHLRMASVCVRVGDKVMTGSKIGNCGNSGNSSEPHLHFHVQTERGFEEGVGIRPIFDSVFTTITLADTLGVHRTHYSPKFPEFVAHQLKTE